MTLLRLLVALALAALAGDVPEVGWDGAGRMLEDALPW